MPMILKPATRKAVQYACMRFHYAKVTPPSKHVAYSVYEGEEWCGAIVFSFGGAMHIGSPYGLVQGQVLELVRVALNGRQSSTSKALSVALRLLKKDCPTVRLVVSYADTKQGHVGTIYQATNWIRTDDGKTSANWIMFKGKLTHCKSLYDRFGTQSVVALRKYDPACKYVKMPPKIKYVYPFDLGMTAFCRKLAKPYPKKAGGGGEHAAEA